MTSPWRKSSRSAGGNNQCVETRLHTGQFEVRDSKLGDDSPVFGVGRDSFAGLLADIKSGRLDLVASLDRATR